MTATDFKHFLDLLVRHQNLSEHRLHRVYYYDAKPLEEEIERPLDKRVENLGITELARHNKSLHADLVRLPFFAMRYGELAMNGWRVKSNKLKGAVGSVTIGGDDLQPHIQQKGVDMRIGLDIASLTLKKLVDIIVLVTSDSDFVPAMKFARREGAQLYLVPMQHGVKSAMLEHADLVIDLPRPQLLAPSGNPRVPRALG